MANTESLYQKSEHFDLTQGRNKFVDKNFKMFDSRHFVLKLTTQVQYYALLLLVQIEIENV